MRAFIAVTVGNGNFTGYSLFVRDSKYNLNSKANLQIVPACLCLDTVAYRSIFRVLGELESEVGYFDRLAANFLDSPNNFFGFGGRRLPSSCLSRCGVAWCRGLRVIVIGL